MKKFKRFSLILTCLSSLVFVGLASSGFQELIDSGDRNYNRWSDASFNFETYQQNLETAIEYYEKALPLIPDQKVQTKAYVLNHISSTYFELARAYLDNQTDKASALAKGKDYALESLKLNEKFRNLEGKNGLYEALETVDDIAALFFYGNNLGEYLNFDLGYALSGGPKKVKVLFRKSVELDERYLGGGPHRALAAFLARTPGFFGGDFQASKEHFENSIQLGPDFLENYVNYAEYYAKSMKNWDLFCANIHTVLKKSTDPTVMEKWPLYNTLAVERATNLFEFEYRGKQVCK